LFKRLVGKCDEFDKTFANLANEAAGARAKGIGPKVAELGKKASDDKVTELGAIFEKYSEGEKNPAKTKWKNLDNRIFFLRYFFFHRI